MNNYLFIFTVYSLLAGGGLFLSSCNDPKQEATDYANFVIDECQTLISLEDSLMKAFKSNDSSEVIRYTSAVNKHINHVFDTLKTTAIFNQDSTIHQAAITLLTSYKEALDTKYPEIIRISKIPTEQYTHVDHQILIELSNDINHRLDSSLNKLISAEKIFTKKYGIAH